MDTLLRALQTLQKPPASLLIGQNSIWNRFGSDVDKENAIFAYIGDDTVSLVRFELSAK